MEVEGKRKQRRGNKRLGKEVRAKAGRTSTMDQEKELYDAELVSEKDGKW